MGKGHCGHAKVSHLPELQHLWIHWAIEGSWWEAVAERRERGFLQGKLLRQKG